MKGIKKKTDTLFQDPDVVLKFIGRKLKKRRKALGYKNSDAFAYDSGINRSQYGKYEAGSQDIRLGTLTRIVNLLGLTLEEFFSDGPDAE